jgi:hypothetical protein
MIAVNSAIQVGTSMAQTATFRPTNHNQPPSKNNLMQQKAEYNQQISKKKGVI